MSNEFVTLQSAIWTDPDFRKLPPDAQWAYMMLLSQPDVSKAGVLTICLGRWAKYAEEMSEERLTAALKRLHEADFIQADWDTYELLIRTFIVHDRRGNGPKYKVAVAREVEGVQSSTLRERAQAEWRRRYEPTGPALKLVAPIPAPVDTPTDTPTDTPADTHPIGIGYVADTPVLVLQSGSDVSVPAVSPSRGRASAAATTSKRGTRLPEGWTPTTPAIDGVTPDLIARELPKFRDYWVAQPGQKGVRVSWDATWRNWLRNTLERRVSGSPNPRQQPEW